MNTILKSANLQAYRLILYRRVLHPELFEIKGRRTIAYGDYEIEAWIMPGAHLMRFQHGPVSAVELVTATNSELPERGLVTTIPCAGEKEHEHAFSDIVNYMATVQTESLPPNLYTSTYEELVEFGYESDALMHRWHDADGGPCASILDLQRFRQEIHAQSYHLISQGGLVLRTQAIFEHK